MVEHSAVNRYVVGSNPTSGAMRVEVSTWYSKLRPSYKVYVGKCIKVFSRIAQLAERLTLTQKVLGSTPSPAAKVLSA